MIFEKVFQSGIKLNQEPMPISLNSQMIYVYASRFNLRAIVSGWNRVFLVEKVKKM